MGDFVSTVGEHYPSLKKGQRTSRTRSTKSRHHVSAMLSTQRLATRYKQSTPSGTKAASPSAYVLRFIPTIFPNTGSLSRVIDVNTLRGLFLPEKKPIS